MNNDAETLAFYDDAAGKYADRFAAAGEPDADLRAFMDALPAGAHVRDLGCGPARAARQMMDAGLTVDATDASDGMIRTARDRFGIHARLEAFEDLSATSLYDGIWANFSLLHAPRAAMPGNLARIHRALKPGGLLHLGLKLGEGEARDALGRFYSYFSQAELETLLSDAGFTLADTRVYEVKGMTGDLEPAITLRAHA